MVDKLDLKLLGIETRKANNLRKAFLANHWEYCREHNPDCSYVRANKPCRGLLQEIDDATFQSLLILYEGN